ncbi:metallophosphoesterase [Paraburkholderia nemoris]|uniref:metallophosphoesterase family protein n=1 Tax=Paraburkholderia nemoris TaxID=2793076 RepID=UPI0038BD37EE
MLRIVHISDLHIRHEDIDVRGRTLLQEAAAFLAKAKFNFEVHAGSHSKDKLRALKTIIASLHPDIIVVTGDVTNFGDERSFEMARDFLLDLKKHTRLEKVICVPGNHDCLVERAAMLAKKSPKHGLLMRALAKVNAEVAAMVAADDSSMPEPETSGKNGNNPIGLLDHFNKYIIKSGLGVSSPAQPVIVNAGWGKVALFSFNSVNDPGFMANEGRIGAAQLNEFNEHILKNQHRDSVNIALLHHHPISAPTSQDDALNRAYDWMQDGPLFLQYLNRVGFHFIMHGHQHDPFTCQVDYQFSEGRHIQILAAGSATQGEGTENRSSFNVLDLLTPFEALFRRYDYLQTGFIPAADVERILPVRPISDVRVYPYSHAHSETPTEDAAMRELVKGCCEKAYRVDSNHEYDVFDYDVKVDTAHRYFGAYRRAGRVARDRNSDGIVFVITGSPGVLYSDLKLRAHDNITGQAALVHKIQDYANQKVVLVSTGMRLEAGSKFNVTLFFEWQASAAEPHHCDAVNLMMFPDGVGSFKYRASLPWRPAAARVTGYGIQNTEPRLLENDVTKISDDEYHFRLEMGSPAPMAYLLSFEPAK